MFTALTALRQYPAAYRGAVYYTLFWGTAGIFEPFLSIHFINLGLSGQQIGWLWALVPLMALVVSPLLAVIVDRNAWRVRALTLILLCFVPIVLGFSVPTTFLAMLFPMLLFAMVRGPAEVLADSVIARMASSERLNFGSMRLWGSLSFTVIVLVSGYIWQRSGYTPMFFVAAGAYVLVALSAFSLTEEGRQSSSPRGFRLAGLSPAIRLLTICSFLAGTALGISWTFIGVYIDALGGAAIFVGAVFALSAITELPSMQYASRLKERFSGQVMLVFTYLLLAVVSLAYALTSSLLILLLLSTLRGIGFGLFFVITVQMVDERAPLGWSSSLQSLVMGVAAFGLARLIGSPLGGALFDIAPQLPFVLSGGLLLVAAIILFSRRRVFEGVPQVPAQI